MSTVKYLFDENVDKVLAQKLWAVEPAVEIAFVGEEDGPPKGTSDPDLLRIAEEGQYLLVTANRRTMPGHIGEYLEAGRHTWGVFVFKRRYTLDELEEDLLLVWSASTAEEWRDVLLYLPL